jgi:hypothetical protein
MSQPILPAPATLTRNVLRAFRAATDNQIAVGLDWYPSAQRRMQVLAGGDSWRGAGVFSAYSPLTPVWRNEELAIDSLTTGIARTDTLPNNYRAAQRILNGEHPLDVLGGMKTRHFTENIALGGVSDKVTVDSIAFSAAINKHTPAKKANIGKRVYRTVEAAYQRAAASQGLTPATMQAIVWVVWRDAHPNNAAVRGSGT